MARAIAHMAKKKPNHVLKPRGRKEERAKTEERLREAFEGIKRDGKPTGPSAFAKYVGVHRTYLYTFPSLISELSDYAKKTQPGISKRGAGASKKESGKRELDASIRREHTKWAKELPELRRQAELAEKKVLAQDERISELSGQLERLRRLYEYLLMLASEAGVSPVELEMIESNERHQTESGPPTAG